MPFDFWGSLHDGHNSISVFQHKDMCPCDIFNAIVLVIMQVFRCNIRFNKLKQYNIEIVLFISQKSVNDLVGTISFPNPIPKQKPKHSLIVFFMFHQFRLFFFDLPFFAASSGGAGASAAFCTPISLAMVTKDTPPTALLIPRTRDVTNLKTDDDILG